MTNNKNDFATFTAATYGTKAHIDGKQCTPYHDVAFMKWLKAEIKGLPFGSSISLLSAWTEAWTARNINV